MKTKLFIIPLFCLPFFSFAQPSGMLCKKPQELVLGEERDCIYIGTLSQAFYTLGAKLPLWHPFLKHGLSEKNAVFEDYIESDGTKEKVIYEIEWKERNTVTVQACVDQTDNCSAATFRQSGDRILIKLYES
ncbi:MAG: hypothetical protein Q3966_01085 [Neisseria sp.]|nr:hypothetical protein [Neisseria sp.]